MANPYLPKWEYVPNGEPRVFGDRVYIYGSHDKPGSNRFCDYKLKVWSASIDNLNHWTCHGDSFHTKKDKDHESSIDYSGNRLFAPDVVYKDGKYYLYAYVVNTKGCVAVSDKPEGPFTFLSQYGVGENEDEILKEGIFIDPGVLVDDDGRVYIYCGYHHSFMAELDGSTMVDVIPGSFKDRILKEEGPIEFFEACSPRKVNGLYYLIYSPKCGSRLAYATSKSPTGPFEYRGIIIDNGVDYPGGNDHGSICKIKDQWYIFYHRTTNNTAMSRRGCVEKITILEDGTIPQVEMTSLGFEDALSPFESVKAELACVLTGGCYVAEINVFCRRVVNILSGSVVGFKYFDFGEDASSKTMTLAIKLLGQGNYGTIRVFADDYKNGEVIGKVSFGLSDEVVQTRVKNLTGRHAIFFLFESSFENRPLCQFEEFVFLK